MDDAIVQSLRRRIALTGAVLFVSLALLFAAGLLLLVVAREGPVLTGAWVAVAAAALFFLSQWLVQVRVLRRITAGVR